MQVFPRKESGPHHSPRNLNTPLRQELEKLPTLASTSDTPPSTESSSDKGKPFPMPGNIFPEYTQAGRFSGDSAAARWLNRLGYDFRKAGCENPSPALFFEAVDILFDGDAAAWLDSSPRFRQMIDDNESSTQEDVTEFKEDLRAKFPAKIADQAEVDVQSDIKTFAQGTEEPLMAYYQRASVLLHRAHGRDAPKNPTSGKSLSPIENVVLQTIISAFVEGISNENLRNAALSKSVISCGSLFRTYEIVRDTRRGIITMKEIQERLAEKRELEQLKQLCLSQYGRTARSVLADLNAGHMVFPNETSPPTFSTPGSCFPNFHQSGYTVYQPVTDVHHQAPQAVPPVRQPALTYPQEEATRHNTAPSCDKNFRLLEQDFRVHQQGIGNGNQNRQISEPNGSRRDLPSQALSKNPVINDSYGDYFLKRTAPFASTAES